MTLDVKPELHHVPKPNNSRRDTLETNDHKTTPHAYSAPPLRRVPRKRVSVGSGDYEAAQPDEHPTGDSLGAPGDLRPL